MNAMGMDLDRAHTAVQRAIAGFPLEPTVEDDGQFRRVGIFGVTLEVDRVARKVSLVRESLAGIALNGGVEAKPRERVSDLRFPFSLSFVLGLFQEQLRLESTALVADQENPPGTRSIDVPLND